MNSINGPLSRQRMRPFGENTVHVPANPQRPTNAGPLASEKQISFLRSLVDERELSDEHRTQMLVRLDANKVSKSLASDWITRLLDKPKRAGHVATPISLPDVPAGRYALTGADGTTDFYKVDRPTKGKWEGYTFVKLLVANGGFGDDMDEQRLSKANTQTILQRIVDAGIEDALARYGHEIGDCGLCGRTLTDPVSIERGIGPVCAGKNGL